MPSTRPDARRIPAGPERALTSSAGGETRDVVVLKIGGSVVGAADLQSIAALHDAGRPLVVVHGGGPLVGEWTARVGLETRFVRGLRVTDEATRDIALAVLAGLVNARIVADLVSRGIPAVGLSGVDGGMLRAEREDEELGLVGRVTLVDSGLLEDLLERGHVPVIAPAAISGDDGAILNVNGDSAAGAIAAALGARLLAFLTDVPGVRSKDGTIIPSLDRGRAQALVADGTIEGGMLPKVEACLIATAAGSHALIASPRDADAIERVLAGERAAGTVFAPEGSDHRERSQASASEVRS